MTAFALSLEIKTVGDREAMRALDDLDKKGRKIIDDAAGALGKSMGSVAVAYTSGSKQMKQALEDVAEGHRTAIKEAERQANAVESLAMRQAHALSTATRGLEMLGRTGELTGRSLDAVLGQASSVAFAFGPTGQIVGAIGIATAAVVEMFMRTSREAKKLADQAAHDFERITDMDVMAQGRIASEAYSGKWNAANPLDRLSIPGLRAHQRDLQNTIRNPGTTLVNDFATGMASEVTDVGAQRQAAAALELVNKRLAERLKLLSDLTGTGGSIQRGGTALAAAQLPGFVTDRQDASARSKEQREQDAKAEQAFQDKMANDDNKAKIKRFEDARKIQDDEDKAIINDGLKRADAQLAAAAKAKAIVTRLAEQMQKEIGNVLAHGIVAGFETAFSGKGIGNAFKTLTATVLAGLGDFAETLGAHEIVVGLALEAFAKAVETLQGGAAIAAGVALMAAGAAMKAVAGKFGGGSSSGGGGSSYSGGGTSAAPDFLRFGVQAATPTTSQLAPTSRPTINLTVIGDGPKIQREIAEIVNSADARGLLRFRNSA